MAKCWKYPDHVQLRLVKVVTSWMSWTTFLTVCLYVYGTWHIAGMLVSSTYNLALDVTFAPLVCTHWQYCLCKVTLCTSMSGLCFIASWHVWIVLAMSWGLPPRVTCVSLCYYQIIRYFIFHSNAYKLHMLRISYILHIYYILSKSQDTFSLQSASLVCKLWTLTFCWLIFHRHERLRKCQC